MVGCIFGACTGVGTVPSLIAALTLSVALLEKITMLSNDFANTLEEKKAKFEQQSTMDGQFANGDWPSAVADKMSDASVRDGDKSDWTPK